MLPPWVWETCWVTLLTKLCGPDRMFNCMSIYYRVARNPTNIVILFKPNGLRINRFLISILLYRSFGAGMGRVKEAQGVPWPQQRLQFKGPVYFGLSLGNRTIVGSCLLKHYSFEDVICVWMNYELHFIEIFKYFGYVILHTIPLLLIPKSLLYHFSRVDWFFCPPTTGLSMELLISLPKRPHLGLRCASATPHRRSFENNL